MFCDNWGEGTATPMTIDERLERLTERVDAIAQSVELLTTLHRDLEQQTAARFSETLVFINRLAHVAEAHEHRLDNLESGH
jgi:prefoldin subunit 5